MGDWRHFRRAYARAIAGRGLTLQGAGTAFIVLTKLIKGRHIAGGGGVGPFGI